MKRGLFWIALAAAAAAFVVLTGALNDVLVHCNEIGIGLGRPMCEAQLGSRYLTLWISLAILLVSIAAAIILRPRSRSDR